MCGTTIEFDYKYCVVAAKVDDWKMKKKNEIQFSAILVRSCLFKYFLINFVQWRYYWCQRFYF
jgi:hypothetical protein